MDSKLFIGDYVKTLVSLTVAALSLTACGDEELPDSGVAKGVLTVSVEGGNFGTRAGFDKDGDFYWSKIDKIGVTTTTNTSHFTSLDLKEGGGTANATFSGSLTDNDNIGEYAVYPYNNIHWIFTDINDVENLTYNFPASYTCDKVDTDFFPANQGEGNSFNPAMFGIIKGGRVELKHLGGVICIKIGKMRASEGRLELAASKAITGGFTVVISDNPDSPMECATDADVDSGKTVTINFTGATKDSSGVFYVPVPTGTYSLNIKVYGDDQNESDPIIDVNTAEYTINRCDLKKIELKEVSIGATA